MKVFTYLLVCMCLLGIPLKSKSTWHEITETDITLYPNTTVDSITVFGLHIGLTVAEAKDMMLKNGKLHYYDDKGNCGNGSHRIYVYSKNAQGEKDKALLYLIWQKNDKLNLVTFFRDMGSYLKGKTPELLTENPFDENSALCKNYLGKPKIAVSSYVSLINYKTVDYRFGNGISVMKHIDEGKYDHSSFAFVRTAQPDWRTLQVFENFGRYGFRDNEGMMIIPPIYNSVWDFENGLAKVKQGNKYGFINTLNEEIIPIKYENAESFVKGKAKLTLNGEIIYVDEKGNKVD